MYYFLIKLPQIQGTTLSELEVNKILVDVSIGNGFPFYFTTRLPEGQPHLLGKMYAMTYKSVCAT